MSDDELLKSIVDVNERRKAIEWIETLRKRATLNSTLIDENVLNELKKLVSDR